MIRNIYVSRKFHEIRYNTLAIADSDRYSCNNRTYIHTYIARCCTNDNVINNIDQSPAGQTASKGKQKRIERFHGDREFHAFGSARCLVDPALFYQQANSRFITFAVRENANNTF